MDEELRAMKLIQGNLNRLPSYESRRRVLTYVLERLSEDASYPPAQSPPGPNQLSIDEALTQG